MEDTLLIDAAERFAKGEMSQEEKIYFEEIRKNNPDVDQLVVEQLFFLNELEKYSAGKNFRHALHETEAKLIGEGIIKRNTAGKGGKVAFFWNKYKRTVAVAASIAGIVSLFIASLISALSTEKTQNIKPLVDHIRQQDIKTKQIENKVNALVNASNNLPVKTQIEAKFRATGFIIDPANNFLVTNAHVVNEARNQLIVENQDGDQYSAESVYVDANSDLAILKITDSTFKKLPALPFNIRKANGDLGERVFTLGFPKQEVVYGEGYISARNGYQMDTIYFQMSSPANEGNSGSPVIGRNGDLIGIITSKETNAEGVVFALKASNIFKAIKEVNDTKVYPAVKLPTTKTQRNLDRETQIKKLQDYVFMIKGN